MTRTESQQEDYEAGYKDGMKEVFRLIKKLVLEDWYDWYEAIEEVEERFLK